MSFNANCLATGIGSVPHTDVQEACSFVFENFPNIPFWPQLPKLSFRESMYIQYCEGLPGLDLEHGHFHLDKERSFVELESFYERYLSEDLSSFAISSDYAAGWEVFIKLAAQKTCPKALKGQVTGPISYGLQVTDETRRSLIYNDELRDVIIKQISRKAQWQERELKKICLDTIMFVDEPYLSSFGSAFVNLGREEVIAILNQVFDVIEGKSAVHCCGNTDWSLLLQSEVDIVNLDAYSFAETLLLYKDDLKCFLKRGGIIAWGIVPTEAEKIQSEDYLLEKLKTHLKQIAQETCIQFEQLLQQSLITPACGVGSGSIENAVTVFKTAANISQKIRQEFGLEAK